MWFFMFKNLFSPESGLMITMTQLTGCIPVVTIGAILGIGAAAVCIGVAQT